MPNGSSSGSHVGYRLAAPLLSRRPTAGAPKRAITHLSELSGGKFTRQLLVDSSKGTTFLKPLDVYSTPAMIWDMEWHVRELYSRLGCTDRTGGTRLARGSNLATRQPLSSEHELRS